MTHQEQVVCLHQYYRKKLAKICVTLENSQRKAVLARRQCEQPTCTSAQPAGSSARPHPPLPRAPTLLRPQAQGQAPLVLLPYMQATQTGRRFEDYGLQGLRGPFFRMF